MTPEQAKAILVRADAENPGAANHTEDECYMDIRGCAADDLSSVELHEMSLAQALDQGDVYRQMLALAVRGAFLCEVRAISLRPQNEVSP